MKGEEKKSVEKMFNQNLIDLDSSVQNEQQLFDLVGMRLIEKGYAHLGYISGLEKREISYPTGLKFPNVSMALPHVDTKYIKKPFIYVIRNKQPIDIKQMANAVKMHSSNFFFLGLTDGSKQPKLLSDILAAFQTKAFVDKFIRTSDSAEMYKLLTNKFEKSN